MAIRWGICSTGKIAESFATALCYVEDAVCAGVSSRSLSKAKAFSEKYGFERAYGSLEEMLSDGNLDVVYIASPMACHFEQAKTALLAGVNVLCEKSVTLNGRELSELLAIAKEKELFFMEAMWMKCRPTFLKAMEWIRSGRIGTVQAVKADFCNNCTFDETDRLFIPELGGGSLLDLAVYPLTLAEAAFGGKPLSIATGVRMGKTGVDFDMAVLLTYPTGYASVNAGFDMQCGNNAAIIGDKGHIEFGNWFLCTDDAVLYDDNNAIVERFHMTGLCNGYEYEVMEVNRCLSAGRRESSLVPHGGTVNVMAMMDECRRQWGFKFPTEK